MEKRVKQSFKHFRQLVSCQRLTFIQLEERCWEADQECRVAQEANVKLAGKLEYLEQAAEALLSILEGYVGGVEAVTRTKKQQVNLRKLLGKRKDEEE